MDEEADPEKLLISVKFTSQLNGRGSIWTQYYFISIYFILLYFIFLYLFYFLNLKLLHVS